jgi:hypothetical protein
LKTKISEIIIPAAAATIHNIIVVLHI